jgi:hypothetical protein
MDLYEILYLMGFLITLAISIIKINNILGGWQNYDIKAGFILFVVYTLGWGVMFITSMFYIDVLLMSMLFKLANMFFALNGLLLIIELIHVIVTYSQGQQRKSYNAKETLNFKV